MGVFKPARQRAAGDAGIVAALDHVVRPIDHQLRVEVFETIVSVGHLDADPVAPAHQERPQHIVRDIVGLNSHRRPDATLDIAGQRERVPRRLDTGSIEIQQGAIDIDHAGRPGFERHPQFDIVGVVQRLRQVEVLEQPRRIRRLCPAPPGSGLDGGEVDRPSEVSRGEGSRIPAPQPGAVLDGTAA